jgi:hypothetical protein
MGLNTSVIVMNDALEFILKDADFTRKLYNAIVRLPPDKPQDVSAGGYVNAATVLETHHASMVRPIWFGGNTAIVQDVFVSTAHLFDSVLTVPQGDEGPEVKLLKAMADELGYRIVRKRKRD